MTPAATGGGAVGAVPTPIADDELAGLFAPLDSYASLALAVSGGGDSLALLHLYARYRQLRTPECSRSQRLLVMTVDHGLRPESAAEARHVGEIASGLGLPHQTLVWTGAKPTAGLPSAAREARYRLMAARLASEPKPAALVTAHTRDDQAETVLMRLARGSGIDGLAGMATQRPLGAADGIDLVRPLLDVPGARLRASLAALEIAYLEDPTNVDLDHERPRLRAASATLLALGLDSAALARSARRLRRAKTGLDWAVRRLAEDVLVEKPGLEVAISVGDFAGAPVELQVRLIARTLDRMGGDHPRARLSEIERLTRCLADVRDDSTFVATLGGCRIARSPAAIVVHREVGRAGLPVVHLAPGSSGVWDGRFTVAVAPGIECEEGTVVIRAPTREEWTTLREQISGEISSAVALTLPVLPDRTNGLKVLGLPSSEPGTGSMPKISAHGLHVFEATGDQYCASSRMPSQVDAAKPPSQLPMPQR